MTKALVMMIFAAAGMQAETLVAKITFPFEVSGVRMEAGDYAVARLGNSFTMRNQQTGKAVALVAFFPGDRSENKRQLQFACAAQRCALTAVRMPGISQESSKALKSIEAEAAPVQVAMVRLDRL